MHRRLAALLFASFALVLACRKEKAATDAPAADGAAGGAAPAESLEDMERQLGELERELGAAPGKSLEGGEPDAAVASSDEDRCTRSCDLAEAICGLKDRICGLAAEHEDDAHYLEVCTRATDDCDRATEACDGCSQ